jgi:hypothetical protein
MIRQTEKWQPLDNSRPVVKQDSLVPIGRWHYQSLVRTEKSVKLATLHRVVIASNATTSIAIMQMRRQRQQLRHTSVAMIANFTLALHNTYRPMVARRTPPGFRNRRSSALPYHR